MEEERIRRPEIAVQTMFLHVLEERAPGSVHESLRDTGRARGEQNEEGVIERQSRPRASTLGICRDELRSPKDRDGRGDRRSVRIEHYERPHGGQCPDEGRDAAAQLVVVTGETPRQVDK